MDRRGRALHLDRTEATVLRDVLRDAGMTLRDDGPTPDADVAARLFPDAYPDDPQASAEFRDLTRELTTERVERVERCRAQAEEAGASGRIELTGPDVLADWIRALNEVRLIMGVRIGVTGEEQAWDPADPRADAVAVYHWLTALQDGLVTAAMR